MTGGAFIVVGPPDSMIGDRNHLAVALLFAIPLMNYLRQQSSHPIVRWGLVLGMASTPTAVVGSQSRGALIGLAATAGGAPRAAQPRQDRLRHRHRRGTCRRGRLHADSGSNG